MTTIPTEYLSLTLRDVLITHAPPDGARAPAGTVAVADITRAVERLAASVARRDAERDRRDREWLAQQFDALTTEAADADR